MHFSFHSNSRQGRQAYIWIYMMMVDITCHYLVVKQVGCCRHCDVRNLGRPSGVVCYLVVLAKYILVAHPDLVSRADMGEFRILSQFLISLNLFSALTSISQNLSAIQEISKQLIRSVVYFSQSSEYISKTKYGSLTGTALFINYIFTL